VSESENEISRKRDSSSIYINTILDTNHLGWSRTRSLVEQCTPVEQCDEHSKTTTGFVCSLVNYKRFYVFELFQSLFDLLLIARNERPVLLSKTLLKQKWISKFIWTRKGKTIKSFNLIYTPIDVYRLRARRKINKQKSYLSKQEFSFLFVYYILLFVIVFWICFSILFSYTTILAVTGQWAVRESLCMSNNKKQGTNKTNHRRTILCHCLGTVHWPLPTKRHNHFQVPLVSMYRREHWNYSNLFHFHSFAQDCLTAQIICLFCHCTWTLFFNYYNHLLKVNTNVLDIGTEHTEEIERKLNIWTE